MSAPAPAASATDAARPAAVGLVGVFAEERWPSMDLVAELTRSALREHAPAYAPAPLRPRMPRPFGRLLPGSAVARNADRFAGRYLAYPLWLRRHGRGLDLFHVLDHSYAHLVHALPPERTVVTCHDLDAFRSLLEPEAEPRPAWFRATMRRVLRGMRGAGAVVCDSAAVRDAVLAWELVDPRRLHRVPLPVHPAFGATPEPAHDAAAAAILGAADPAAPEVLHVGSTAPRKRLPLLLEAFAALRARLPGARLVRAGGPLPAGARALAQRLGIGRAIVELPHLERPVLAAVYRRAAVAVLPSAREGFGWPVLEALACGAPVVAADLPVLREVGGAAAAYVASDDPRAWADAVVRAVAERGGAGEPRARGERTAHAAAFSTRRYAEALCGVYGSLLAPARRET